MKKLALCIALASVLVMGVSSTSLAGVGVGIDKLGFCNDMWLDVDEVAPGTGVYALHGVEAGTCPAVDALFTGSCQLYGGAAYFGVVGSYGAMGDGAALKSDNFYINFSNSQGSGYYSYFYFSSGTSTGFGAGPYDYSMTYPVSPPMAPAEGEAFEPNDGPAE